MTSKTTSNKVLPLPKQGEIWLVKFSPTTEDWKQIRPYLVLSDNIQNQHAKWIVVIPLTTEDIENIEPFEVFVENALETGRLSKQTPIQLSSHSWPSKIERTLGSFEFGDWKGEEVSEWS